MNYTRVFTITQPSRQGLTGQCSIWATCWAHMWWICWWKTAIYAGGHMRCSEPVTKGWIRPCHCRWLSATCWRDSARPLPPLITPIPTSEDPPRQQPLTPTHRIPLKAAPIHSLPKLQAPVTPPLARRPHQNWEFQGGSRVGSTGSRIRQHVAFHCWRCKLRPSRLPCGRLSFWNSDISPVVVGYPFSVVLWQ